MFLFSHRDGVDELPVPVHRTEVPRHRPRVFLESLRRRTTDDDKSTVAYSLWHRRSTLALGYRRRINAATTTVSVNSRSPLPSRFIAPTIFHQHGDRFALIVPTLQRNKKNNNNKSETTKNWRTRATYRQRREAGLPFSPFRRYTPDEISRTRLCIFLRIFAVFCCCCRFSDLFF